MSLWQLYFCKAQFFFRGKFYEKDFKVKSTFWSRVFTANKWDLSFQMAWKMTFHIIFRSPNVRSTFWWVLYIYMRSHHYFNKHCGPLEIRSWLNINLVRVVDFMSDITTIISHRSSIYNEGTRTIHFILIVFLLKTNNLRLKRLSNFL